MQLTIIRKETVTVKYLRAVCGVRYWEDARVNGEEDTDGDKIPCRSGDTWSILIDIEKGQILSWPTHIPVTAHVHYKVCDNGVYALLDKDFKEVVKKEGYVPRMLGPNGYGDYVVMDIDAHGSIAGWEADLSYFTEDE